MAFRTVGSMTRNQNLSQPSTRQAPGPHSQRSILLPHQLVPRAVLALVSPGTRAVEVHVGDKLPAPACAYQCKTNRGKTLVLNAKDIGNYVWDLDRGARRVCGAFWHLFLVECSTVGH